MPNKLDLDNQILLFNKPFRVLSQFSPHEEKETLASFINIPKIYPAGRLDYDSEGLLLLTGNGPLQHHLSNPKHKQPKSYWVQVEGDISEKALLQLTEGVELKDGITLPAEARQITEPENLWSRQPPIRERANIPTSWIELVIKEGKNRQVRRMTAAVGFPTLRLIRSQIGPYKLAQLRPGESRIEAIDASLLPPKKWPPGRKTAEARKRPSRNNKTRRS